MNRGFTMSRQSMVRQFIASYTRQPDARTCQSSCVAQMMGLSSSQDVYSIRSALEAIGDPGSPSTMGAYLKSRIKEYQFDIAASLNDARKALDDGYKLITHGWFTGSGHVVSIVGWESSPNNLSYRFIVDDPWAEFSFPAWRYLNPDSSGNDLRYSSHGMYAACVVGQSPADAYRIYKRGELDSSRGGMWLHLIKN